MSNMLYTCEFFNYPIYSRVYRTYMGRFTLKLTYFRVIASECAYIIKMIPKEPYQFYGIIVKKSSKFVQNELYVPTSSINFLPNVCEITIGIY